MTVNPKSVQVGDKLVFEGTVVSALDRDGEVRVRITDMRGVYLDPSLAIAHHPAPRPLKVGDRVQEAWQDLLDKSDRTSPAEYPEMALITRDELADYMALARSDLEPLPNEEGAK